jgi:predicted RNA-binding Zn-ribbon protein involved in translation (DUF1610 family)
VSEHTDDLPSLEFPCKSCGATLTFTPGASALTCTHCGSSEAIPASADEVIEHPFEDYKEDSTGWGAEFKRFDCEQCGARTEVEAHISSFECAFCGSSQVVAQEHTETLHKPESLLPFVIDQEQCVDEFRRWIKRLWFRPNALKKQASPKRLRGVYMPFWTYDSLTNSWWTAEAGYYYYVTDSKGNKKRKIRWEPASGTYNAYFDDILIQGSPSLDPDLVQSLMPFETAKLVDYKPEYLAGMAAEDYREDMLSCWPSARNHMDSEIYSSCRRRVPGDRQRNLNVQTSFLNRTYKLCLLPIWIANYRFNNTLYRYLVNGHSGKVTGQAPWSWVKITLFVLTLAAGGALIWWKNAGGF